MLHTLNSLLVRRFDLRCWRLGNCLRRMTPDQNIIARVPAWAILVLLVENSRFRVGKQDSIAIIRLRGDLHTTHQSVIEKEKGRCTRQESAVQIARRTTMSLFTSWVNIDTVLNARICLRYGDSSNPVNCQQLVLVFTLNSVSRLIATLKWWIGHRLPLGHDGKDYGRLVIRHRNL